MSTILVIPDLHLPYTHKNTFDFLDQLAQTYSPDFVVQIGDLMDMHRWGRWLAEPDSPGQVEEMELALEQKDKLAELFPKLVVLLGNHDLRFEKQAKSIGLGSRFIRSYSEVFELPKEWQVLDSLTVEDEPCGPIYFFHGDGFTGKYATVRAAEAYRMNVVFGHSHSYSGVMYSASPSGVVFGMNVGCLVDIHSFGLAYGKHFAHKPTLGAGVIVDGVPVFEPLREKDYV